MACVSPSVESEQYLNPNLTLTCVPTFFLALSRIFPFAMLMNTPFSPNSRNSLHAGYSHETLRAWQQETILIPSQLVYPLFVIDGKNGQEEIHSMPGQFRWTVDRLENALTPLVRKGLKTVLLFGVPSSGKDAQASRADQFDSPVVRAIQSLRDTFPDLLIVCDVCLCAYTDHGHCCIFDNEKRIDNQTSIERLAEISVNYAKVGAHIVAPSDMMDGRIGAIKQDLRQAKLDHVAVMSYAAKFASCFYGPFREAAHSAPAFGDRHTYQLPPYAKGLALRAIGRDVEEGADFIMVKPAGPYLDLIREAKNTVEQPIACYQVSGEYAMLYHAAQAGTFDLKSAVLESLYGMRRAGASILVTYFTPQLLDWL